MLRFLLVCALCLFLWTAPAWAEVTLEPAQLEELRQQAFSATNSGDFAK
ncbi:MAG: hypothetical protein HC895_09770, partial [Leptolyngbyaceae cyanobacterium SM1_3_5]|nr:hypothetical protein [Leptolyngbyaceae cyanobacterium SM1_3_5]